MGGLPVPNDLLSSVSETYTDRVTERLGSDPVVTATRDRWAAYVRATQGEVFADLNGEDPGRAVDRTFRAALHFDYLVGGLLDAVEATTGVTLANRDPRTNTDVDLAFGRCHDRILPPVDGRDRIATAVTESGLRAFGPDDLRDCYRSVVDRDRRLSLGEYFTPRGVADVAVDELDWIATDSVLDPGCGTGVFLTACIDRIRDDEDEARDPDALLEECAGSVVGFDLNPVAVRAAKLAYLCHLVDELGASDRDEFAVPVFLTDSLGLTRDVEIEFRGHRLDQTFDALVGNPPWIPWERVTERVKDGLQERYVDELGLQPHSGMDARLGHSNDDLAVPFAWVCIHRYLRAGGTAAFVLKRDSMQGPAGAVLRRLQVGDRELALEHVHDFSAVEPFADVGANAAVYAFSAETEHSFPVSTTVWTAPGDVTPRYGSRADLQDTLSTEATELRPLDRDDASSAWVRADAERAALGDCAHEIRHGLKDDAADVFGLDRSDLDDVDADLVYPYIQSRHVRKYGITGHDLRLVPMRQAGADNRAWLRENYPTTERYLRRHRETLEERSSSWLDEGPFYSVFGLGEYTWAPYKVVWCRLGFKPDFAVVSTRDDPDLGERQVVPGDHYMFIATAEAEIAHALCALLNSAPYQRTLRDVTGDGKSTLSKSVVSELRLPPPEDIENRARLANRSMTAHDLVSDIVHEGSESKTARELAAVQSEIDRLVASQLTGDTERGFDG